MRAIQAGASAIFLFASILQGQTPPAGQQSPAAQPPPMPRAAASTFASVAVLFSGRLINGRWMGGAGGLAGPAKLEIVYGQPHARGRVVFGTLVPWDSVWRSGANLATQLTTDVDVVIGGALVKRGVYTLYSLPTRSGWKLIINRQTGQWGTEYDPAQDLARVDLRSRTLAEPVETFSVWLVPAADQPARGVLKMAWEKTELSVDWRVNYP